ncbi:unnamed protein product [Arctogadus glacialis]
MAWPCITRACCINRFWSELDKGDIAVPLVFTKYSDVADVQHFPHHPQPRQKRSGPIAIETQPHLGDQESKASSAAGGKDGSASVTRQDYQAWKVRPEPSCKPRNEYHPCTGPFNTETQYQKDYKPWPIPKKGDHPWIPKPSPTTTSSGRKGIAGSKKEHAAAEAESGVEKSEIEEKVQEKEFKEVAKTTPAKREKSVDRKTAEKQEEKLQPSDASAERKGRAAADALNRQIKEVVSTGSSYRNEFKAYKDVKPTKSFKTSTPFQPPGVEVRKETSYSSTYKGEQGKLLNADNKLMDRRRIRSLYNEPSKEAAKQVDKPASRSKPKKTPTTTTGRMVKKTKEKLAAGALPARKKASSPLTPTPEGVVTKKSKEMSNRLAEAKH